MVKLAARKRRSQRDDAVRCRIWPPRARLWLWGLLASIAVFGLWDVAPASAVEATNTKAAAPCATFRVRPQDAVWAVSTRGLGCPAPGWTYPLTVWQYESQSPRWANSTLDAFTASDDSEIVTVVYIHGNRIDSSLALQDGLSVYFQLAGAWDHERPIRFVVWTWPSDQIRGPLKDVRAKASRSDVDAYYLAQFLTRVSQNNKVGLLGYSYGARIACGGVHLLGGGRLDGLSLPAAGGPELRVALWAAAEHDDWLLPGRTHGEALPRAEQWLITRNCCDPVLSRYRLLDKCSEPTALGFSGLVGRNLLSPEINQRIEEIDVTGVVGSSHDMQRYLYARSILDSTREVLFARPTVSPPAAAATAESSAVVSTATAADDRAAVADLATAAAGAL
jgi:hypothetical protein